MVAWAPAFTLMLLTCISLITKNKHDTVQLDLNLMLEHTVPASKNTHSACAQPGTYVFIDLHPNRNPLHIIHDCTVHAHTSLGT